VIVTTIEVNNIKFLTGGCKEWHGVQTLQIDLQPPDGVFQFKGRC
jgi:hypothetical protein